MGEIVRLSIPGNYCTHCGAEITESLVCPGCGWADPLTVGDPADRPKEGEDDGK